MCDKPKEFSYGRCFSIIYRHGKTIIARMILKFHLTGGQSRYVARICDNPGISQEELAQLQRSANTMREMIDKLDG